MRKRKKNHGAFYHCYAEASFYQSGPQQQRAQAAFDGPCVIPWNVSYILKSACTHRQVKELHVHAWLVRWYEILHFRFWVENTFEIDRKRTNLYGWRGTWKWMNALKQKRAMKDDRTDDHSREKELPPLWVGIEGMFHSDVVDWL